MPVQLPSYAAGPRPLTVEELLYRQPVTGGPRVSVPRDQLQDLLNIAHEHAALKFALEHQMRIEVAPDGGVQVSVDRNAAVGDPASHRSRPEPTEE